MGSFQGDKITSLSSGLSECPRADMEKPEAKRDVQAAMQNMLEFFKEHL
jgi:hypothetical protein